SITYLWNFGDGSSSNEVSPWHLYDNPGDYTVTLTVSNGTCADSISKTIHINSCNSDPCTVDATFWVDTLGNGTYQFTPLQQNSAYDYHWLFDDMTTSNQMNPTHTYSNPGKYVVQLSIINPNTADSCADVEYEIIYVSDSS